MSWRKKHIFINLSWHGGHGPLLSPFEGLEVPKLYRSSIVWPGLSKTPAPLELQVKHFHIWSKKHCLLSTTLEGFYLSSIILSLLIVDSYIYDPAFHNIIWRMEDWMMFLSSILGQPTLSLNAASKPFVLFLPIPWGSYCLLLGISALVKVNIAAPSEKQMARPPSSGSKRVPESPLESAIDFPGTLALKI